MEINYKLLSNLRKETRRLATKVDSYLEEFEKIIFLDKVELKTINDFFNNSKRFLNKSSITKKQVKEVFYVFNMIDENEKFILDEFNSHLEFINLLTNKMKKTLINDREIKNIFGQNTYKLLNNFVYINFVSWVEKENKNSKEFFNKELEIKTQDLKTKFIKFDDELYDLISQKGKLFLERNGFNIKDETLSKKIVNIVDEIKISNHEDEKKKIKTDVVSAIELIKKIDTNLMTIPFYQREYVWTEELLINFLNQISDNKNKSLNIGNILISLKPIGVFNSKMIIVDGQQRITTLIMILNCLAKKILFNQSLIKSYSLLKELQYFENENFIRKLENKSNKKYIEELNEVLNIDLKNQSSLNGMVRKRSFIFKNYVLINNFLDKFDHESKINLFNKFNLVFLTTTSDKASDEIELFINTNSSRKPLTNYDLIRSFLVSKIREERDQENAIKLIEELDNLIKFDVKNSNKSKDIFFKIYLNYSDILTNQDTSFIKDLFKRFIILKGNKIQSNDDLIILLKEIIRILKSYKVFKMVANHPNVKIDDFIIPLGSGLNSTSIYDNFLLFITDSLISHKNDNNLILLNQFRKILLTLEKFDIKWKLFNFKGDSLTTSMNSLFKEFYDQTQSNFEEEFYYDIYNKFINIINKRDGFIEKIIKNKEKENLEEIIINSKENLSSSKIALKILNRVSFSLFNNGIYYDENINSYYSNIAPTIEHIFPQNNTKWKEEKPENVKELEEYLENIGNKFIFNKSKNSSAGNKTFSQKKLHYKNNNDLKLDETLNFEFKNKKLNLFEQENWSKEDIILREEFIITSLINIWKKYE
ncbi:MAG: hypothetical protein TYPL_1860 [Candidatus Tyloplasma litorale]|nr:MAG: hypothetical protein TYPL_1860 [Mycoplasmatales bacterium]